MINKDKMIAVILTGGKSKRYGSDKSFLKIGKITFIEKQIKLLTKYFDTIVVSANEDEKYKHLNLPICNDIYSDCGPLAGIHAVMKKYKKNLFVLACDLPFVDDKTIKNILKFKSDADMIFSATKQNMQPLCAIYKINLLPNLDKYLKSNNRSVFKFIENINHSVIQIKTVREKLININTQEDYNKLIKGNINGTK